MRMRFKPWAGPELAACPFHLDNPAANKGGWRAAFPAQEKPLHVELGCGKGSFLARMAAMHPENNYIGIDITNKVLALAKRNIDRAYAAAGREPDNVRIFTYNIESIRDVFAPQDCVQRVYINFCNPWNRKKGHKKHRLTHPRQLVQYRRFLADEAELWFKCDDEGLFDDTFEYLAMCGFEVAWNTRDLHTGEPEWNIRTEHEQMFAGQGVPIKALIAKMQPMGEADLAKLESRVRTLRD